MGMSDLNGRSSEAHDIAHLLKGVMGEGVSHGLSNTQRATKCWYEANGKKEERHTCGVWLKEPTGGETLPTLVVYIDSNVIMQDFVTNHEIYKLRLERVGLHVKEVQFRLSKWKKGEGPGSVSKMGIVPEKEDPPTPPRELTEEEIQQIDSALETIKSDNLRRIIRQTMISSKQWEDAENT